MRKVSWLQHINLFVRSLIFFIYMPLSASVWSIVCIVLSPLPLDKRYGIVIHWTTHMIWVLKVLCHVDYKLEGAENIPKNRNGVILCKHQSAWETFFVPGLFNGPSIILKRELFWVPFFGWGLATVAPIAINRKNTSSAMEQIIKQGKMRLESGRWVLVFPEGTRIAPGHVGKYRLGGARLAVATGYPVIPIAHNAGRFWSKRKFIKRPGTIRVVIGPLIETVGRTPEDVLDEAKNWIEDTIVRIDKDWDK